MIIRIFLLLLVLATPVYPQEFDYDEYTQKYDVAAIKELQSLLDTITYRHWVYEKGVFDCSNQTAYLFDFLSGRGYDCTIVVGGTTPFHFIFPWLSTHGWLITQKNGRTFLVESTEKLIQKPGDLWYYKRFKTCLYFKSLGFLRFITTLCGHPDEWTY